MPEETKQELTPELVLQMFAETREQFAKTDKKFAETREYIKEVSRNANEVTNKLSKDIAALTQNVNSICKEVGGIGVSNGMVAEEAIYNALERTRTFYGIKFDYIRKNVPIQSESFQTMTELDILMVNGDTISIIETKYKVERRDVHKLLNVQLKDFRRYCSNYNAYKVLLGIGGMSFDIDAEIEAKNNGIGIIKIVGDTLEYQTENIKIY